jgi:hypothetical protein
MLIESGRVSLYETIEEAIDVYNQLQ